MLGAGAPVPSWQVKHRACCVDDPLLRNLLSSALCVLWHLAQVSTVVALAYGPWMGSTAAAPTSRPIGWGLEPPGTSGGASKTGHWAGRGSATYTFGHVVVRVSRLVASKVPSVPTMTNGVAVSIVVGVPVMIPVAGSSTRSPGSSGRIE